MKTQTFQITPVSAPRMSRQDRWMERPVVVAYKAYGIKLRTTAMKEGYKLASSIALVFTLPMPVSWSEKKKERFLGKPHQQRPDIDNLIKGFLDSLLYRDKTDNDSRIWNITAYKIWGQKGSISVENVI